MKQSRVSFLYLNLTILDFQKAMKALDVVIKDMCAEKGFRRHDGNHYYYHLVDVAQTLLNFGVKNEDIITAAILHDYAEDVKGVSIKLIEEMFGTSVAGYVSKVTKKKGINYKEDDQEMVKYLNNIESSLPASLIKTADRMHNFSSMRSGTSILHKEKQVDNTERFFIPFFKRCRNNFPQYSYFFFFAKTTIEPLIYEMKQNISLNKEIEKYKRKEKQRL